jgi:UDP-N-acetylmuramate--alanine ligase
LIADAKIQKVQVRDHQFHFDYSFDSAAIHVVNALPGFHNVENATAAISACLCLQLPLSDLAAACSSFKGVKRRFEYVVNQANAVVIDDYAHHPTELKACINSVRELYPQHKLTGIFQPHLFSRTRDFVDDFAAALDLLDECWLLDIYPARELPIAGINSEYLALKMQKNALLMAKDNVLKHLQQEQPELLLILGAGDIDQLVKPIKDIYEKVH